MNCPYCNVEMCAVAHNSELCNGFLCPDCVHEEPEMDNF